MIAVVCDNVGGCAAVMQSPANYIITGLWLAARFKLTFDGVLYCVHHFTLSLFMWVIEACCKHGTDRPVCELACNFAGCGIAGGY